MHKYTYDLAVASVHIEEVKATVIEQCQYVWGGELMLETGECYFGALAAGPEEDCIALLEHYSLRSGCSDEVGNKAAVDVSQAQKRPEV